MSNRVSFASVLRGNPASQPGFIPRNKPKTLSQFMDIYTDYGQNYNGYILNLDQSGTQSRRNVTTNIQDLEDYEEGVNPLEAWVKSQSNIGTADRNQRGKKSNDLIKLVNSNHQQKNPIIQKNPSKIQIRKPQKNMNMGELCKMYANQKDSCQSSVNNEPVWKFNSRQEPQDQYMEESSMKESVQKDRVSYQGFINQIENKQNKFEYQEKPVQVRQDKITEALRKIPANQKSKRNLAPVVQEIKENLATDIEMMAEQIVENRRKEEDEEMLISQRSYTTQNERLQNARKQIGQYLKIKDNIPRNEENELEEPEKQETGVGYSFAHEFNEATKKLQIKNKESMLPNIEEVRSEQDFMENHQRQIQIRNNQVSQKQDYPEIGTQYIQEIQSVAYFEEKHVPEEKIKQSYRYSEKKNIEPPTIQLSLEHYVRGTSSPEKEEEIQEICSSSKDMETFKNTIKNMESYVADKKDSIIQNYMKESKKVEQRYPETDSLEIDSVLNKIQPKLSFKVEKEEEEEYIEVASSLKNSFNEAPVQQEPEKVIKEENQPQIQFPLRFERKTEHKIEEVSLPQRQIKLQHKFVESKVQVMEKPRVEEMMVAKNPPKIEQPILIKTESQVEHKIEHKVEPKIEKPSLDFKRIISPQQSIKQSLGQVKKQENSKKIFLTLNSKNKPKTIQAQPQTNAFNLSDKESIKKIQERETMQNENKSSIKVSINEERKQNNESLMNQMPTRPEESMMQKTEQIAETQNSIMRKQEKKIPLMKASLKKSVNLNNSVGDDFQFDLDDI